jgi:hypothetical protein
MSSPPPQHTIDDLAFALNQLQTHLSTLTTEVHGIRNRLGPPGFPPPSPEIQPFPNTSIKLDIPRFDSTDPLSWIFKINQFFDFHHTPDDQRLRIAAFYMEGEAITLGFSGCILTT